MQKRTGMFFCLVLLLMLCGCKNTDAVTVESVASITGSGYIGASSRFTGVVAARSETVLQKDENRIIDEIKVETGDCVKKGQVLFTYDTQAMQLSLEKAQLEVAQTKGSITSLEAQKASLEKSRAAAEAAEQLQFTLEIKDIEAQLLEAQYNLSLKEKELEKLQAAMEEGQVTSPVEGIVQSIATEDNGDDMGDAGQAFMTILETGQYRIKGTVNEFNRAALEEGAAVCIRSRISDAVWHGTVSKIDWDNPVKRANDYTQSEDDMEISSNYPFYVDLEQVDGLILGQHVYVEVETAQNAQADNGMCLPSYYCNEVDEATGTAWVWAANQRGRLEKRTVQLGEYLEELDCWMITAGLSQEDLLAVPEDGLEAGMQTQVYDPNIAPEEADVQSQSAEPEGEAEAAE